MASVRCDSEDPDLKPGFTMHLNLRMLLSRCPQAHDIWTTNMPAMFMPSQKHTGRLKGMMIQELQRYIHSGIVMLHMIARNRRKRWYARLHNGAMKRRYASGIHMLQGDSSPLPYPAPPYDTYERYVYMVWRNSCLFRGLRPDWMRVCPDREQALYNEFNQPHYLERFKLLWKDKVARIREHRQQCKYGEWKRDNDRIQTIWIANGGHIHRMPAHRWCKRMLTECWGLEREYVARFLVLLMQGKQFRQDMYMYRPRRFDSIYELEEAYPDVSKQAKRSWIHVK